MICYTPGFTAVKLKIARKCLMLILFFTCSCKVVKLSRGFRAIPTK